MSPLAHAAHPGSARPRRGSRTVNSVKSPTSLSTVSVPPCCWVMLVAYRQAKSRTFAGRFGCEEGLEQFIPVFRRNTDTVVAYENAQVARRIFKLYLDIACVGVTEGI